MEEQTNNNSCRVSELKLFYTDNKYTSIYLTVIIYVNQLPILRDTYT